MKSRGGNWLGRAHWLLLLLPAHIDAQGLPDFGKEQEYTCTVPITAGQPLGQSVVWKALIEETKVSKPWSTAQAKVSRESADHGRGPYSELFQDVEVTSLFLFVGKDAAVECARSSGLQPPSREELEHLLKSRARAHGEESLPRSAPVVKAVEHLQALLHSKQGEQARRAAQPVAPVAARLPARLLPAVDPGEQWPQKASGVQPPCEAKPGTFCLSTLLGERNESATAFELCALTQTVSPCLPGFYCEGGEEQPRACQGGMWCPGGTASAVRCEAGYYCPVSIIRHSCPPGFACSAGQRSASMCEASGFCTDGIFTKCPDGHFCHYGATEPEPCPWFASCPAGARLPNYGGLARWSLAVGVAAWVLVIKVIPVEASPKHGYRSALVALLALVPLSLAWLARLELAHGLASWLSSADPSFLKMRALFGGSPHATGLVFLSLAYCFLLHGFVVSARIQNPTARVSLDLVVCAVLCLLFNAYMQDLSVAVFFGGLWAAFRVVWQLLTQQGPLSLRVGLLAAAFVAVAAGLLCLGEPVLVECLVATLAAVVARALLVEVLPRARFALRTRRVQGMESMLREGSFGPLVHSLASEPLGGGENPEAHPATAAKIAASVRASLAEKSSATAVDPEAHAAWLQHFRGRSGSGSSSGEDDGSCFIDISDEADSSAGVSFELRDVSYCLNSKQKLLHDLSFTVPAAGKVAVMGASGSGKTTLLSVLSGRCPSCRLSGELRVNGMHMLPRQMAELRPLVGYVPQDDVMHVKLTVRENIEFQAELRLHGAELGGAPQELVDEVIEAMGLGAVADRIVGDGLSGGQRKRVSIGMEVVTKPRVLLLDEPSSGLDTSTAHRILERVLKGAIGCTIFSTIHQPRWSTLSLFDILVLLAPGGHLVYAGPVAAAKAYFRQALSLEFPVNENPADLIVDASSFESARKMAMSGAWKCPPQCLRAVVFPTPEVTNEEYQSHWQQVEFGRILASLWRSFAAATRQAVCGSAVKPWQPASPPLPTAARVHGRELILQPMELEGPLEPRENGLLRDARARAAGIHWGRQVWLHVSRTLLTTCRALWPTIAFNILMMELGVVSLSWAFGELNVQHLFLPSALLYLLLSMSQSVAAQRLFGGEEQQVAWREAGVSSFWQVLCGFVGKDLASLTEIVLSSMCFALTYWPLSGSLASGSDFAALGFASLYCVWGLNHIWAVALNRHVAMMMAIIVPFLCFLFSGIQPVAADLVASLGGLGKLLLMASPVRWSLTYFVTQHTTGAGSHYFETALKSRVGEHFRTRGFSLDGLQCPDYSGGILDRWLSGRGHSCHTGQLFLLGFLFRFIAAACLLLMSSSKTSGGQLPLGVSSRIGSCLLHDALMVFLAFFVLFELLLLGETY